MNQHSKLGYAVVDCKYTFTFKRIEQQLFERDGKVIEMAIANPKNQSDNWSRSLTYYAKCAKGKTGDQFLSRWYKEVVIHKAKEDLSNLLEKKRQENESRLRVWESSMTPAEKACLTGNPKPAVLLYDDLDMKRLEMVRLYSTPEESGTDFGEKIPWLP